MEGYLTILNQYDYSIKASLKLDESPLQVLQKTTNTDNLYALVFCKSGWIYVISLDSGKIAHKFRHSSE